MVKIVINNTESCNNVFFSDDASVNQLLGRLDQCNDNDKYNRIIRQLQDMLETADQRVRN